ncbi:MAG: polymer-forming cytoskeletal protein [Rhodothermales bacterium]
MGKAALLAIAALIVTSSYYTLSTQDGQAGAAGATAQYQLEVLARNAAMAGYSQARQGIADAGTFTPFTYGGVTLDGTYSGGHYETTISSNGDVATIESVGTVGRGSDAAHFTINAVVGARASAASSVPPFLAYALLTNEDLLLNGNVGGYVDEETTLNANFHTNGNLHVNGNAADVSGFGTYVGSGTSNPPQALANTFQPNHNPDELSTAYAASPIDIPTFDADAFLENVAVDETSPSTVVLAGTIDPGGTRENPYVWHVKGDLVSTGGATIHGYVLFVVDGDINLSGNLIAGADYDESNVALYAGDDVTINGNVQIHGQIYAGDDVTLSGTPDIYGSIAARSSVTLNGTPGIHYRPASPSLATIFSDTSTLHLVSYYEH